MGSKVRSNEIMSLPVRSAHSTEHAPYYNYLPHQNSQPRAGRWLTQASPIARATMDGFVSSDRLLPPLVQSVSTPPLQLVDVQNNRCDAAYLDQNQATDQQLRLSMSHLQLSDIEAACSQAQITSSSWPNSASYTLLPDPATACNLLSGEYASIPLTYSTALSIVPPSSPFSNVSVYDDSSFNSPSFSSPDCSGSFFPDKPPRSSPYEDYDGEEEDEAAGGKPYARLIYEALLQAPGHRMMLRDIYDWFELYTTKPRESGTNGWQNSIRHNLSMNKVC